MKKNSQIHIYLETDLYDKLEKQAQENNISLSQFCRKKLQENSQLTRIEMNIEKIFKVLSLQYSNK